jgi:hypothetical protein
MSLETIGWPQRPADQRDVVGEITTVGS